MKQNLYSGFADHPVQHHFHYLRIERSQMVVSSGNPRTESCSGADIAWMNSSAKSHHAIDYFSKYTTNYLGLSGRVETCHKRSHQTLCRHTAQASAAFYQQYPYPKTGSGDSGTHSGRPTSYYEHICFVRKRNVAKRYLIDGRTCCKRVNRNSGCQCSRILKERSSVHSFSLIIVFLAKIKNIKCFPVSFFVYFEMKTKRNIFAS